MPGRRDGIRSLWRRADHSNLANLPRAVDSVARQGASIHMISEMGMLVGVGLTRPDTASRDKRED